MDNLDQMVLFNFDNVKNIFNASLPTNAGNFILPVNNDETMRDVIVQWQNLQKNLTAYLTVNCNNSAVITYKVVTTNLDMIASLKTTATDYVCGYPIPINYNEGGYVVLVQNTGTSKVTYKISNSIDEDNKRQTGSSKGLLIAIVIIIIAALGVATYIYLQRRKKLQEGLAKENQGRPLIDA